jgi:formylglycine-generating enzyme required for sulfatase activity
MSLLSKRYQTSPTSDARAVPAGAGVLAEAVENFASVPTDKASDDPQHARLPGGEIENSLGMRMVEIPAGEFWMGNQETADALSRAFPGYEHDRIAALVDEQPPHKVRITRPFLLGRHAVTIGQFRQFVLEADYQAESERDGTGGWGYNPGIAYFEGRKPEYSWRDPGFPQDDRHPVVNVTWNDALALCQWLSRREGRRYRLPSEAEWEYACRAETTTRYHSGDEPEGLVRVANLFDAACRPLFPQWSQFAVAGSDGCPFTAPVGSYQPNDWGLYDMHGNVWEWCADWYGHDYYRESPSDDPTGPETGEVRIRRGGSWHSWPLYLRSSYRNWNVPDTRYVLLGMRLACDAD